MVINASDQCFVGKPNSFAYGLTKGALGQITKSLSLDLAPKIRINAVCAGTIKTPMVERLFQDFANITHGGNTDFYWQNEAEKYPLKK
ncbi:SDR family oxidoreductase [Campylobacter coli]|nr:SDR family oxidoreductase [Campylobacter coli]